MAPDAEPDQIRRAYLTLARAHHPDTTGDAPPAEQAEAERRMREVNAAWQVLRNPRARAAYDALLRSGRVSPSTSRSPSEVSDASSASTQRAGPSAPPSRSLFRFGPIAVVVAVLLAVLVFTAYANKQANVDPSAPSPSPSSSPRYEVGSCVRVTASESGLVPIGATCGATAAYRIASTTDLGRPCPEGTKPLSVSADKITLCLAS